LLRRARNDGKSSRHCEERSDEAISSTSGHLAMTDPVLGRLAPLPASPHQKFAFPAKTGIHFRDNSNADEWVPAFAGNAIAFEHSR
jgi:hypothetical protein